MADFSNAVAVVSGAGSEPGGVGIGEAIARQLAASGAHVVIGDIDGQRLEHTLDTLLSGGLAATQVTFDATDSVDCSRLIDEALRVAGRIDVVVNSAGVIGPAGTALDVDADDWDRTMTVNVKSAMLVSRYAIPHMAARGGGAIVNIASVSGIRGGHPALAYATSKGAMVAMTRAMAVHHGRQGIRVNCVAPGMVYTPLVVRRGVTDELRAKRAAATLLGTEGEAWDVAHAVSYLASNDAKWVTGVVLPVDGGVTAGDLAKPSPS